MEIGNNIFAHNRKALKLNFLKMENASVNKISVQRVKELLARDGVIVDDKQAKEILDFLQIMADIAVAQYVKSKRNGSSTNS